MRRALILAVTLLLAGATAARGAEPVEIVADVPPGVPSVKRIDAFTVGPKHHFVGYYGITPWNSTGKLLACLEAEFGDRLVEAADKASICLVDTSTHAMTSVAQTSAWNLQQGAMLHWLPTAPDRELVFNDCVDGRLVAVILDVQTKQRRMIDHPIAALSADGKRAISLNYDRLRQIRPVTGYAGGAPGPLVKRPKDDGLWLVDLATGDSKLLVSVDAACGVLVPPDVVKDQPFWLEHAMFSRDDSRVFLIARAFDRKSGQIVSIPLIFHFGEAELFALMPWSIHGASHYDWLDAHQLVLTRAEAPDKWQHILIDTDNVEPSRPLAEGVLTRDGHCTFSPDGRWMVTDTYPDEHRRQHLFLLNVKTNAAARVASFHAPAAYRGDWRCDLHPRWSRDSRQICIDSAHDGVRQVYVIELNVPPM